MKFVRQSIKKSLYKFNRNFDETQILCSLYDESKYFFIRNLSPQRRAFLVITISKKKKETVL